MLGLCVGIVGRNLWKRVNVNVSFGRKGLQK